MQDENRAHAQKLEKIGEIFKFQIWKSAKDEGGKGAKIGNVWVKIRQINPCKILTTCHSLTLKYKKQSSINCIQVSMCGLPSK